MGTIGGVILATTILFALIAVGGLVWAIQRGQFRNFKAGARSIFDEDEPVGKPTDGYPRSNGRAGGDAPDEGGVSRD